MALRSRPAGGGFKPPRAALAEDCCGERRGKGVYEASGGDQEDDCCRRVVIESGGIRTGCFFLAREESGGSPMYWPGGVRRGGDVSLICGFRMERGKACSDMAARQGGERDSFKRQNREELSTVAGCAGGPVRSSDDVLVMRAERRGRIIRGLLVWSTGLGSGGAAWTS